MPVLAHWLSIQAVAYWWAGLYSVESAGLIPYILPSIVVGVPVGAALIRRIRPETFRRVCMSFDAWIVGFGLSNLLKELHLVETNRAFLLLAADVAAPDLVIYLQAPTDVLLRRLSDRAKASSAKHQRDSTAARLARKITASARRNWAYSSRSQLRPTGMPCSGSKSRNTVANPAA